MSTGSLGGRILRDLLLAIERPRCRVTLECGEKGVELEMTSDAAPALDVAGRSDPEARPGSRSGSC